MITTGRVAAFVAGIVFAAAPSLLAIQVMRSHMSPPAEPVAQTQVANNGDFIRDYLLENPEIIRDAFYELERRKMEAEKVSRKEILSDNKSVLLNSTRQVVLGNPDGDVTLVEFFDYNCGYCKRALGDMNRLIKEDNGLRVVLKEFPVLGQGSVEAAHVATAISKIAPDKYNAFHQELLGGKGHANGARALAVADKIGIDPQKLQSELKDPEIGATIEEVYGLAKKLGLTGTPSYVVGDEIVFGAVGYDELKNKIADVRKCGSTMC